MNKKMNAAQSMCKSVIDFTKLNTGKISSSFKTQNTSVHLQAT